MCACECVRVWAHTRATGLIPQWACEITILQLKPANGHIKLHTYLHLFKWCIATFIYVHTVLCESQFQFIFIPLGLLFFSHFEDSMLFMGPMYIICYNILRIYCFLFLSTRLTFGMNGLRRETCENCLNTNKLHKKNPASKYLCSFLKNRARQIVNCKQIK